MALYKENSMLEFENGSVLCNDSCLVKRNNDYKYQSFMMSKLRYFILNFDAFKCQTMARIFSTKQNNFLISLLHANFDA